MNNYATTDLLDELAELDAQNDVMHMKLQDELDALLTPDLLAAIDRKKADYQMAFSAIADRQDQLRTLIQHQVKAVGQTVTGERMQAVYQTRTSWDTKGLNGYAVANPQILRFRTETPSVSIRNRKGA